MVNSEDPQRPLGLQQLPTIVTSTTRRDSRAGLLHLSPLRSSATSSLSSKPQRNQATILFSPGSILQGSRRPSYVCSHKPVLGEASSRQRPEVEYDDDTLIHALDVVRSRAHVFDGGRLSMRLLQVFESLRDICKVLQGLGCQGV